MSYQFRWAKIILLFENDILYGWYTEDIAKDSKCILTLNIIKHIYYFVHFLIKGHFTL